jgi:predicted dehydrogenase
MNQSPRTSRRRFLRTAAWTGAAIHTFPVELARSAPSQRVRLGFIGCGGRARQLMPMFVSHPDAEVVAISDVIEPRMEAAIEELAALDRPQRPERMLDYRRILDRRDVDAVVIATTQHWHGRPHIHACQAGKHIFVEKPLSHTVVEGRSMVEAARHAGVKVLMGTQQRAGPHYQEAIELIRNGRLGNVALVECWNYHNTGARTGRRRDAEPPPGYHWDQWLGPAPWAPFNWGRLDSSWWFDYGGGMLTNWAVHHIDIILWAMNARWPKTVSCQGGKLVVDDLADTPDLIESSWAFEGWLMQYRYRGFSNFHTVQQRPQHHGIAFHGHRATMVLDRHGYAIWNDDQPGKVAEEQSAVPYFNRKIPRKGEQDGPWQRAFVDWVREKIPAPMKLEASHEATVCCHLANVAYRVGRILRWDGAQEVLTQDPEASALLDRPRRPGYELPEI